MSFCRNFSGRRLSRRQTSSLALTIAFLAGAPAVAQEAAAEGDAQDGQSIVVTGFRASLESAVNKKKRAEQIVESVSAEDIGKLPDVSIAESLARLPGLAAQRVAGRAQVISVRAAPTRSPFAVSRPTSRPRC